jgi:hypothetical protein
MIAGLILGTLISALSALLLPVIFPAVKESASRGVTKDLRRAANAARLIETKLQRVIKAEESEDIERHRRIQTVG